MEIQLTLNGRKRKEAADCVGEVINTTPVYLRAPTYSFDIGGVILDRHGVLTIGDFDETLPKVLAALQKAGFYTPGEEETPEAVPEIPAPSDEEQEPPASPGTATVEPEAEPEEELPSDSEQTDRVVIQMPPHRVPAREDRQPVQAGGQQGTPDQKGHRHRSPAHHRGQRNAGLPLGSRGRTLG